MFQHKYRDKKSSPTVLRKTRLNIFQCSLHFCSRDRQINATFIRRNTRGKIPRLEKENNRTKKIELTKYIGNYRSIQSGSIHVG